MQKNIVAMLSVAMLMPGLMVGASSLQAPVVVSQLWRGVARVLPLVSSAPAFVAEKPASFGGDETAWKASREYATLKGNFEMGQRVQTDQWNANMQTIGSAAAIYYGVKLAVAGYRDYVSPRLPAALAWAKAEAQAVKEGAQSFLALATAEDIQVDANGIADPCATDKAVRARLGAAAVKRNRLPAPAAAQPR